MIIVFAVEPGPDQQQRIDIIRQRAIAYFSKCKVMIEEDCGYLTVIVSVTVTPDPPYGPLGRYAIFPNEKPVYLDWPSPPRTPRR